MLYIFDMGGVLTTSVTMDGKLFSVLGVSQEEFERICGKSSSVKASPYFENLDLFKLCTDGVIDSEGFWSEFAERSGMAVKTDWFRCLFHPKRDEGTVAVIKALKAAGNRVVCGTNTISAHYATHVERGDYAIFDQTYASFWMGVSKPNYGFWRIIMEAEECLPKDVVFIDDREENCEAASDLGIRAIRFTSAGELANELGITI